MGGVRTIIVTVGIIFTVQAAMWYHINKENSVHIIKGMLAAIQYTTLGTSKTLPTQPSSFSVISPKDLNLPVSSWRKPHAQGYSAFYTEIDDAVRENLKAALKNATNEIIILLWYAPFNSTKIKRTVALTECGNCKITYNRSKINEPNTKAVVFHFRELDIHTMPDLKKRRADQYYIFWSMESTVSMFSYNSFPLEDVNGLFNLTMTHRRDSDIFYPYWNPEASYANFRRQTDKEKAVNDNIRGKTKLALWVVSNCISKRRLLLANTLLRQGLAVDLKGKCYQPNINKSTYNIDITKQYKFYFAFENSYHCLDYITEKLGRNAFKMGAVPVVFGATKETYIAFAPPNSFIFAEDYTPQQLVDYLNYLDQNETAYREYFKWRLQPQKRFINYNYAISFCQLCRMLHGINVDLLRFENRDKYKHIPLFGFPKAPTVLNSLTNWIHKDKYCVLN